MIDAYFHLGWTSQSEEAGFASRQEWMADPMRQRVMRTFGLLGERPETQDANVVEVLRAMDSSGVTQGILVASQFYPAPIEAIETQHGVIGDTVRAHPGRFVGIGTVVPPAQGPATYWDLLQNPRLLEQTIRKHGFVAVHITPGPWGTPPNDRWYYPLYAKCVELRVPVYTYVGMPAPFWPMYPNYPLHLDDVCLAFPELVVIAHHIGDPWVEMMTHMAGKYDNLYICTSAWSPKRYPAPLLAFMRGKWHRSRGAEKVIFGTDYPLLNLERAVAAARNLDLPEEVLEKFLYSNARRILLGSQRAQVQPR